MKQTTRKKRSNTSRRPSVVCRPLFCIFRFYGIVLVGSARVCQKAWELGTHPSPQPLGINRRTDASFQGFYSRRARPAAFSFLINPTQAAHFSARDELFYLKLVYAITLRYDIM